LGTRPGNLPYINWNFDVLRTGVVDVHCHRFGSLSRRSHVHLFTGGLVRAKNGDLPERGGL
jgi:hypothetical protein